MTKATAKIHTTGSRNDRPASCLSIGSTQCEIERLLYELKGQLQFNEDNAPPLNTAARAPIQNRPPNAAGSQFMMTNSSLTSAFPWRWLAVLYRISIISK